MIIIVSPDQGPVQIEESGSHGMPHGRANSATGAVVWKVD